MSNNNEQMPEIPVEESSRLKLLNPSHLANTIFEKSSEVYDGMGFALFRRFVYSCLHGHYVYGKNSGSLYVGSATFYALLSIIPVLSCATFLLGIFQGDMEQAHQKIFGELQAMIPPSGRPLLSQIGELTQAHLKNTPLTFANIALLVWSTKGFFSTLVEGLMKVTNTRERGGAVMGTLRALGVIMAFGGVLLSSFEWGPTGMFTQMLIDVFPKNTYAPEIITALASWQVFTIASNALMVTLLYRWLLGTNYHACAEGAAAFIGSFLALKSFYWIYLHYNEASTVALFGGFAPMVISILWGYFAMTAFFIGACISSLPRQKAVLEKIPKMANSWDEAA